MDRGDMSPDSYDYEGAGEDDLYSNDDSKSTLSIPSLSSQREQRGSHSRPHGHEQAIAQMKESLSHLGEGTQMRRSSNAVSSPVGPSFDDLMSELSELYTKLEAKDKDLVMAGEMGSMLLEKNEEANARVEELTVQVEELQEETDKLKNAVRGEERKNARLHKQLEEHEHREKELSDAVENLRAELATEREKGKGRKETQAKTEELSDELSGRIRDLESKLARQIAEYTKLSKEHAATQEAIDELKDQLTDAQQEIAKGKKIATQYQQAVAEIEKLKADNKTNQLSALQFENSHLTETVMGLTQELQKYQQVYEENKHLYQVAQQKIEQLTNDNAALKKKLTLNVPSPKALGPRKTSFVSLADDLEEDETSKPTTPKVDTRAVTFPLPSPTTEPTSTPETVTTPPVAAAATTPKAAPTEPAKPTPVETSAPPVVPSIPLPSSSPMSIITGALASSPRRTSVTDAFKATSPIEASIFDVDQKRAVEPTPAPAQVSTIDPSRSMHAMQQREKEQKRQLESTLNNPLQQQPIIASPPQQQQRPFIPTYTIASPPPAALQQQQQQQQQQQPTQTPPQTARSGWFSSITSRITGKSSTPVSQPGSARQLATTSVGYGASPLHVMPGDPDYIPPVSGLHEYGRSVKPATDERALWEFFSLSVLSIKLNAGAGKDVELLYSINAKELWEKAKKENLQFHQYHDWLKIEINKSYYHKLYKSGGTGIPMHGGGYAPPQARPAVNVAGIPAAYQQRTTPLSFSALVFGRTQPAPNPVPPTPATPPISQHLHSASSYGSAASSSSVHTASPQPSRTSTSQKSASPGLTASSHGTYSNQASLSQSLLDADDDEHTIQERLKAVPLDPHEISQLR